MDTSKTAVVVSTIMGKIISVLGYIFGIFSLIFIIVGLSDLESDGSIIAIIFLLIVLVGCIFLVIKGLTIKRRIKRFKRYVILISSEQMTLLQNIANATSQSVDYVRNDLQKMINKKFFANASIDLITGEIVIGYQTKTNTNATSITQPIVKLEMETVNCAGCGATNSKQIGTIGNCEYCGTSLK